MSEKANNAKFVVRMKIHKIEAVPHHVSENDGMVRLRVHAYSLVPYLCGVLQRPSLILGAACKRSW